MVLRLGQGSHPGQAATAVTANDSSSAGTALRAYPVDGMKALRLRTRRDYRVHRKTLGGVSRERWQRVQCIAFDAHKHYTLASVAQPDGQVVREERLRILRPGKLRNQHER